MASSAMAERYTASGGNFTPTTHSTTYDYISPLHLNLTGKHVVVTGAAFGDGVGYATATAFARAGPSAIALADLQPVSDALVANLKAVAAEAGRTEPKILVCTVDITSLASVQDLHKHITKTFETNSIDILVNNAAHMEPVQRLLDSDPEVYWRTWEVNVRGLMNMARVFLPSLLLSNESKTMLNLSSSGALSARPAGASYRSSKLAIMRWTESLQLEYGEEGLLTFCVNPGSIRTQLSASIGEKARAGLRDEPSMAGDTIVWLASQRREWLSGRYVSCPWDMEELMAMEKEIVGQDKLKLRMAF
jgi:NAD(P)-dependent dehydrogenase (short-subunit alcohol dehydrogenase family)